MSARKAVQNALLAALPSIDHKRMLGYLKPVSLSHGDILYEPGERMRQVYFPITALISLLALVEGHLALEVGMIGREGMLGILLILGVQLSPVRALVQCAGLALVMSPAMFLREFERSAPLRGNVLGFTHALMSLTAQLVACNRFHPRDCPAGQVAFDDPRSRGIRRVSSDP